jgi:hypothetical protein
MAEELKIVLAVDGADKVATALGNTSAALKDTATEARNTGQALNNSLKPGASQASQVFTNFSRVISDAPYGFNAISNNIGPLVDSFGYLKTAVSSGGSVMSALTTALTGPAGIGIAIAAITTAITFASQGFGAWSKKTQETKAAIDETKKALSSIQSSVASEATNVTSLVAVLQNETETRQRKVDAIKELQRISPEMFNNLKIEGDTIVGLTSAYQAYLDNLKNVVAAKVIQNKLEKEFTKLLELEGATLTGKEKAQKQAAKAFNTTFIQSQIDGYKRLGDQGAIKVQELQDQLLQINTGLSKNQRLELAEVKQNIDDLTKSLSSISQAIDVPKIHAKTMKAIKAFYIDWRKLLAQPVEAPIEFAVVDIKTDKPTPQYLEEFYRNDLLANIKRVSKNFGIKLPIELEFLTTEGIRKYEKDLLAKESDLQSKTAASFNKVFQNVAVNVGTNFAETLGMAIAGQANMGDILQGVFSTLADGVVQLGKELIQIGTLAILAQSALNSLFSNPYAAIAVGIALTALGTAIKASTSKKNRFAVGTRYAPGGMALVGERGPEMINLPRGSQVIPAAQTSAMLGGRNSVEVYGVLRGQDIYFSNKKYAQSFNRQT